MEIKIKEIENYEDYKSKYENYLNDSMLYEKPTMEFSESIVGLVKQEIYSYRILSKGMVEPDKKEIKIISENGQYITNYSQKLHSELESIINDMEEFIAHSRNKEINKD